MALERAWEGLHNPTGTVRRVGELWWPKIELSSEKPSDGFCFDSPSTVIVDGKPWYDDEEETNNG